MLNSLRSDEPRRPLGGRATVGDAVRNADRAKPAPGHEQAWKPREVLFDGCDTVQMADFVLRALTRPPIQPGEERRSGDGHHLTQRRTCKLDQFVIVLIQPMGIAAAPEKCAQQYVVVRRAMRPFRRDPCRRQKRTPFNPRYDEPASTHWM